MDALTLKDHLSQGLTFGQIAQKTGTPKAKLKILARKNNLHSLNAKPFSTRIVPRIGDRFDKLVITEDLGQADGKSLVLCDCDCGAKEVRTDLVSLRGGHKRSCGCLVGKAPKPLGPQKVRYVIGQKYGKLTPVSIERVSYGKYLIRCKCECGGESLSRANDLRSGRVKSCGCIQREAASINGSLYGCKNGSVNRRNIPWFFYSPEGHKITCDSSWEVIYANHLKKEGIRFIFHPECFKLKTGRYSPDFLLIDSDTYVEVKGRERGKRQIEKRAEFSETRKLKLVTWDDLMTIEGMPTTAGTTINRCRGFEGGIEEGFAMSAYLCCHTCVSKSLSAPQL